MSTPIQFEKSISDLEEIVAKLEKGELTLEDSLQQFEKGIVLAKQCQDILTQAELKIATLTSVDPSCNEKIDE